jgi:hypothetical protein
MSVRKLFAALLVILAMPLAASAETFDFVVPSISISVPPAVATAMGPVVLRCDVLYSGFPPNTGRTALALVNGRYSGTNLHVSVDSGPNGVGNSPIYGWDCYLSLTQYGGVDPTVWLGTSAGKAALGNNVILDKADNQTKNF